MTTRGPTPPLDPLAQAGREDRAPRKLLFKRRPTARAQELRRNLTAAEKLLWRHLSRRRLDGWKFSRQMPVGPFICDFMCREARLAVELDGGQHDAQARRDAVRTAAIEAEGYRVVRFWNNEVIENLEGVLRSILAAPEEPHPQPLPQAGGEAGLPLDPLPQAGGEI